MKTHLSTLVLTLLLTATIAHAELLPLDVLVIGNSENSDSVEIAKYYVERRQIPDSHLLLLPLPESEQISRADFEKLMIAPIRSELAKRNIAKKIKAFVTVYGVPLQVQEATPTKEEHATEEFAKKQLAESNAAIQSNITRAQKIADDTSTNFSELNDKQLAAEFNAIVEKANNRIQKSKGDERKKLENELADVLTKLGGVNALSGIMRPAGEGEELRESKLELEKMRSDVKRSLQTIYALDRLPNDVNRTRMYSLTEQTLGLIGVRTLAQKHIAKAQYSKSSASVDSELSLLWWDRSSYPLSGRLPNPLHFKLKGKQMKLPVLMHSRLDGPQPKKILSIIDETIEAETSGLLGKVYIDTRGLKYKKSDSYSVWDQSMKDLGWLLRNKTDYDVHMDASPQLIEDAKDVALYVGWYRLRDYQDVFTFKPGAIAWHIASEEAVSVRNPEEKGWCKNFLERKVAVTIGATQEPYLESFPHPLEFVGLLLTGKYSLAEAYFLTIPNLSWRMVLFGDPLYNPWKGKNLVEIKDLKMVNLGGDPITEPLEPPSEKTFHNPAIVSEMLREQREASQNKLDTIFK